MSGTRRQRDWQKTDPHLRRHPAFLRFRTTLGVNDNEAHGILAGLWAFAFDFAQDGDLSRFSHEDVALSIGYLGDPEQLFKSLGQYFLDGDRIRSWEEWGGALFTDRTWEAKRKWDQRHKAKRSEQEEVSQGQNGTVPPCPTREEKKREELTTKTLKPLSDKSDVASMNHNGFDKFWKFYPKKSGKQEALKRWAKMTPAERERATVVAQAITYCIVNGYRDIEFVPMGSTFLNQARYEDWYYNDEMVVPADYQPKTSSKANSRRNQIDRLVDEMERGQP